MATANYVDFGYPYVESHYTGPLQHTRTSQRSSHGRFHPYMGRNVYNTSTLEEVSKPTLPPQQEPMYQPHYNSYFIAPIHSYPGMTGNRLSTAPGSHLAQQIMYEDMLGLYSRTREPVNSQFAPLQTLQDVCDPTVVPGTNQHCIEQTIDKSRSHPFYWRKRSEPAAGMTRTRDKYRVVYTEKQRIGLEKAYADNQFITMKRKTELSKELDLSERQIKIWFQNRRAKERRDSRKSKDTDSSEDDHSIKDDNDVDSNKFVNTSTKFPASCRFNENNTTTNEADFSTGQCRFMKHGGSTSGDSILCGTTQTGSMPDCQDVFQSRHSLSPTEWNIPLNNTLPTLNVSPLAVTMDFGLLQRM